MESVAVLSFGAQRGRRSMVSFPGISTLLTSIGLVVGRGCGRQCRGFGLSSHAFSALSITVGFALRGEARQ